MILFNESYRLFISEKEDDAKYFGQQQRRLIEEISIPIDYAMQHGMIRKLDLQALSSAVLGNIQKLQMHMIMADCKIDYCIMPTMTNATEAANFLTSLLLDGLCVQPHCTGGNGQNNKH